MKANEKKLRPKPFHKSLIFLLNTLEISNLKKFKVIKYKKGFFHSYHFKAHCFSLYVDLGPLRLTLDFPEGSFKQKIDSYEYFEKAGGLNVNYNYKLYTISPIVGLEVTQTYLEMFSYIFKTFGYERLKECCQDKCSEDLLLKLKPIVLRYL